MDGSAGAARLRAVLGMKPAAKPDLRSLVTNSSPWLLAVQVVLCLSSLGSQEESMKSLALWRHCFALLSAASRQGLSMLLAARTCRRGSWALGRRFLVSAKAKPSRQAAKSANAPRMLREASHWIGRWTAVSSPLSRPLRTARALADFCFCPFHLALQARGGVLADERPGYVAIRCDAKSCQLALADMLCNMNSLRIGYGKTALAIALVDVLHDAWQQRLQC